MPYYEQTRAEEMFCTEAQAQAAGYAVRSCANHFVRRHSEDAAVVAAMRADELMEQGDLDGARTFQAIVRRINELQALPSGPVN